MRPRKTILLYCADEVERSLLSLKLDLWGYAVTRCCSTHHPCLECLGKRRFDLLLVVLSGREWGQALPERLLPALREQTERRGDRALLLDDSRDGEWTHDGEPSAWKRVGGGMALLREAVRMSMARKRGPKKAVVSGCLRAAVAA